MHDGCLVTLGIVKGLGRVVKRLLDVARGKDEARELAVPGVDGKEQVALFSARRHARRRAAPLVQSHHEGHLVDAGPAQTLDHEREAGAGRGRGATGAGQSRAAGHRDRCQLVLRLDDDDGPFSAALKGDIRVGLQVDALVSGRADGIIGLKGQARCHLAQGNGLVAPDQHHRLALFPGT